MIHADRSTVLLADMTKVIGTFDDCLRAPKDLTIGKGFGLWDVTPCILKQYD